MNKCLLKVLAGWVFAALFLCCYPVYGEAAYGDVVEMITPLPTSEIIAKKPEIKGRFTSSIDRESLLIFIDDTDITALAQITDDGFQCRVPYLLPSGNHILSVSGNSEQVPFAIEVEFSSRHTVLLDEIYTTNEWSLNAQASDYHSNTMDDYNLNHLDSTLSHQSVVKKGNWDISLQANVRYFEQNLRVESPEREGFDIINFLFRTHYQHEIVDTAFEFGDLQLQESKNTFESLSRHGGQFNLSIGDFYANAFSVLSRDSFGVHDGSGIGFDDEDHLYGVSGGMKMLNGRVDLKSFYFEGGQQYNSFSSWSQEEGNRGDLYGFVLNTDLWQGKLTTEFEYDVSDFDPDISDDFSGKDDRAYRVDVNSAGDIYSCGVSYKYFGSDYDLPGNLAPQKNYHGVNAFGDLNYGSHSFGVALARYYDNVDSDSSYARITSTSGELNYFYSGFSAVPISLSYQRSQDKSGDEPAGTQETDLATDTVTANIGFVGQGILSLSFTGQYSQQKDRSDQDQDTRTTSFTISPTIALNFMTINVSSGLIHYEDLFLDTTDDNYLVTVDIQGALYRDLISYELGGTYDKTLTDDDYRGDGRRLSGYARLACHLPWFAEIAHPSLGLEIQYDSAKEQSSSTTEETRVLCTFSTLVPFSF